MMTIPPPACRHLLTPSVLGGFQSGVQLGWDREVPVFCPGQRSALPGTNPGARAPAETSSEASTGMLCGNNVTSYDWLLARRAASIGVAIVLVSLPRHCIHR